VTGSNYSDFKRLVYSSVLFQWSVPTASYNWSAPSPHGCHTNFFFFISPLALHLHLTLQFGHSGHQVILGQRAAKCSTTHYNTLIHLVSQYMKINLRSLSLVVTQSKSRLYYTLPISLDIGRWEFWNPSMSDAK